MDKLGLKMAVSRIATNMEECMKVRALLLLCWATVKFGQSTLPLAAQV